MLGVANTWVSATPCRGDTRAPKLQRIGLSSSIQQQGRPPPRRRHGFLLKVRPCRRKSFALTRPCPPNGHQRTVPPGPAVSSLPGCEPHRLQAPQLHPMHPLRGFAFHAAVTARRENVTGGVLGRSVSKAPARTSALQHCAGAFLTIEATNHTRH
jgi:hypothetical protein